MPIAMSNVGALSSTRVRVTFSGPVAVGALDTSLYVITSRDDTAASPWVKKVLAVAGINNSVELVLGGGLAAGGIYTLVAEGVPGADSTTTPAGSNENFAFGAPVVRTNVEPQASDADLSLYGRDIAFNGVDFVEGVDHDLAVASGLPNAAAALSRRLLGSPLVHAPNYSPNTREYVDANDASGLKGVLIEQAMRDDRVKTVTVDVTDEGEFIITPTFAGGVPSNPISVSVKT